MQVCDKCGKRKVRNTVWEGSARTGSRYTTDEFGKKKLAPCNGNATRLCRSCLQNN